MQYNKHLLAPLLAATALAAPKSQTITANYDNITVIPTAPLLNPVGVYEGLNYTNWVVNQAVVGAMTHSPPNFIVTGFEHTSVNGGLAMFQKAGKTQSFDLKSFYYDCAVNSAAGDAAVGQQCAFLVRGYRKVTDTQPVAQSDFTFDPRVTDVTVSQVRAVLDYRFSSLEKVDFVMLESASGETGNVIAIDSVTYTVHY